ncbi:peptidase S8 and S53 subtilisin kexin sedolisin [Rhizobium sp. CF080]|uniref:S8/S53 family peptidase n=1 Tax=Rhizobium sp. (strain CF080) TaxID=1144310 RepID=UPI0002715636|nr:S8/S53 family peptidase [Rhizobium sp. CF080]EUB99558.1 peptidase S8 and S53 subtilisin kexin sedolisin [Rhizobium sp. CF080]
MSADTEALQSTPISYYYLWHLTALGVIDADYGSPPLVPPAENETAVCGRPGPEISGTIWDTIAASGPVRPARVALIDVGVAPDHPNLITRLDRDASIDLTTHRYGSRVADILNTTTSFDREEKHSFFAGLSIAALGNLGLSSDDREYLNDIVSEYAASQGVIRRLFHPEALFSSHGTCCAGLIVGEPAVILEEGGTSATPESAFYDDRDGIPFPSANRNVLPYFGVDPFSQLISIRTSFEDDVQQFIAAFLYAFHMQADVIVLPRGLPDPKRSRVRPKNELKADLELWKNQAAADLFARIALGESGPAELEPKAPQKGSNPDRAWHVLKQLIIAISRQIPVVCAAGNSGESQLIYPASLAAADNGIIAVGAVTVEGYRSGYSNYGEGLTVVSPADDGEVFNRHQLRVDRLSPFAAQHDYGAFGVREYQHSHFSLLTTDLPGIFGYGRGAEPWSAIVPFGDNPGVGGGYYTAFGGTSGASALAGGVCALIQRAHKSRNGVGARLSGPVVKSILRGASRLDTAVAPGVRALTADCMNAEGEDALNMTYFFGSGLPDVRAAVAAVLAL